MDESATTAPVQEAPERTQKRSLVMVAGSGRSGTSLFSGIIKRLGYHVPQPEVPADQTNPKGFAEPQWVVDFHDRLLRQAGVQTSDARPAAWARTAQVGLDAAVRDELRAWLDGQFSKSDDLLIKDPRLSWFIPLWRQCAEDLDCRVAFVTMLRHPGAVIDSKQRYYGGWQGEVARAAGWVGMSLFTERATRESPRAFVRYDDLLDDWTTVISHVGDSLPLPIVQSAQPAQMREVHEFVDRGLVRSRPDWGEAQIPERLRGQADETWELLSELAKGDAADEARVSERLDAVREQYVQLYEESEAIAQSSIAMAHKKPPRPRDVPQTPALRAARRVPGPLRRMVPVSVKRKVVRTLKRRARPKAALKA